MSVYHLERTAPAIIDRAHVRQPLLTGYISIDTIVPIGQGQRQLVIGNYSTGKSYLARHICWNQRRNNRYCSPEGGGRDRMFCVYACIGVRAIEVRRLLDFTKIKGISWYTIVKSATAGQSALLQYLTAFEACARGEGFRDHGFKAVVIYDTITNHAVAHRQMSLLLRKYPGRECYPGDTFYMHARLLERSSQLSKQCGFGALTALPLIETQIDAIGTVIITNLISICDGQMFLNQGLAVKQHYPAVDVLHSVSRVGVRAQVFLLKEVAPIFRTLLYAYYRSLGSIKLKETTISDPGMHNKSLCAFNLSNHGRPRFFEENILLIVALEMGLLCPNHTEASLKKILSLIYQTKNRWVLILLVMCKYKSHLWNVTNRNILTLVSLKLGSISPR